MKKSRDLIFILAVLGVGLFLRLIYLRQYSVSPLFNQVIGPDVAEYYSWARQILSGKLLWDKVNIHSPLYPYYLALLYLTGGGWMFGVRFLQLLFGLLAMVPLFWSLRRLSPRQGVFRLVPYFYLLLAAIYPPLWFYEGETVSEALLIPLVTLSLWAIFKADQYGATRRAWCWRGVAGILCGLAIITHPLSLFFAALEGLLLVWLCFRRRRFRFKPMLLQTAVFAAGIMLSLIPVSAYNSRLHGSPVLVQKNSGYNFYLGNNPEATGGCYIWPGPDWDRVHGTAAREAHRLNISSDAYFYRQSADFILHHPLDWLKLQAKKALYVWNWQELAAGPDLPLLKYFTPIQRGSVMAFGLLAVLALIGLLSRLRDRRFFLRHRHPLLLLFAVWGGLTLTVVSGRYRIMFIAALFIFAAWGIAWLIDGLRQPRRWPVMVMLALFAVLAVFAPRPQVDAKVEAAQAYTIIGEAYLNLGDRDSAEIYLKMAQKHLANWSRSYNILGKMYEETEPARAEKLFHQAINVEPQNAYGYMNLGGLFSRRGDMAAAKSYFDKAMELAPEDPQVLYNTGYFYMRQSKVAEAEKMFRLCVAEKADSREAINALGVIAMQSGRYGEAAGWFEKAVLLDPRNYGLQLNLAIAYWSSGKSTAAIDCLQRLLKAKPGHPMATKLLGQFQAPPMRIVK